MGNAAAGLPGCLGDIYEEFEKEDMSEMFREEAIQCCREILMGEVLKWYMHM